MVKFVKKYKGYLLSLFIPALLLILVFFCLGFLYTDGKTIIVCDLDAQYRALLIYFKENIFTSYSFSKGLGGGMFTTIAYYLLSPFNIITFLFSAENIHLAALLIIYLKLCISGLTMYLFLKKTVKNGNHLLWFSTTYVFIAFTVNFIYHIMWLDAIYMLPIVILGLHRLIHNNKTYLYICSLTYCILTNYYMGFIVCIFSFLYFIYEMVLTYQKKDKKMIIKRIKSFIFSSLLAALLCSIVLVPILFSFKYLPNRKLEMIGIMNYLDPLMPISKIFIGMQDNKNILARNQYQLYTGILTGILVLFFFMNSKINKKEKNCALAMIAFFALSLSIDYLYYIWHGFTPTNGFPGRFTFVISFFLLILGAKSIQKIQYIEKRHYFYVAPVYPILGTLVFFSNFSYVKPYLIWISVTIFFLYLFLLYCIHIEVYKKITFVLLFLLLCSELVLNMFFSLRSYTFLFIKESKGEYKTTKEHMDKILEKDTDLFFRTEKNYNYSHLDSFIFHYNSIALFLSTIDQNQSDFISKVGYYTVLNEIEYDEKAPVMDSLLGIKYIFSKDKENTYYKKIDSYQTSSVGDIFYNIFKTPVYVYQNDYALSLGTLIQRNIGECDIKYQNYDRLDYQNQLISCLVGENLDIYEKIPVRKENVHTYSFENTERKDIYFFPNIINDSLKSPLESVEVFLEDFSLGVYSNIQFRLQKISNQGKIGKTYKIRLEEGEKNETKVEPYVYYFNEQLYKDTFSELRKHRMQIKEIKDGYVKGSVAATKENHYLFTTIPNSEGWKVFVDDVETKYDSIFDTFIGIDLEEGNHKIEFVYQTPGLKIGIFMTILGSFILGIYMDYRKNIRI